MIRYALDFQDCTGCAKSRPSFSSYKTCIMPSAVRYIYIYKFIFVVHSAGISSLLRSRELCCNMATFQNSNYSNFISIILSFSTFSNREAFCNWVEFLFFPFCKSRKDKGIQNMTRIYIQNVTMFFQGVNQTSFQKKLEKTKTNPED